MNDNEYKCAVCGEIYEKVRDETWSEEKAIEELKDNFGNISLDNCEVVCDDCWQVVKPDSVQ